MNVGVCQVDIRLPESTSLKSKRHVVKSITARLSNRFNVAVAEVGNGDKWQLATIGVCCISNDRRHADEMLSRVISYLEGGNLDAEILDYRTEIIPVS